MAGLMKFSTGVLFWDLNFVRAIQDWELESLSNFLDSFYRVSLRGVRDDKICWKPPKGSGFAVHVHSYYQILTSSPSHGRLFGSLRSLVELFFLFGLQFWGIFDYW